MTLHTHLPPQLEQTTLQLSETNSQLVGYKQLVGDQALLLESLRTKIAALMILQRGKECKLTNKHAAHPSLIFQQSVR